MSRKHLAVGYKSPTFSTDPPISIETYCEQNGLELVAVFSDDRLSSHLQLDQRPSGSKLFGHCRRERIRNVVAPDLYNLFKDSVDAGRQLSKWWKRVRLHLVNFAGHPFIVEGEAGLAFTRMAEALGKMERRNIRERIGSSIAKRKVLGYVYGGIPYGWDRVGSLLVENVQEQKVKKRMKDLRGKGMPFNAIANLLNSEGVLTKKSGKWYASSVFSALQSGRTDFVEDSWTTTHDEREGRRLGVLASSKPSPDLRYRSEDSNAQHATPPATSVREPLAQQASGPRPDSLKPLIFRKGLHPEVRRKSRP